MPSPTFRNLSVKMGGTEYDCTFWHYTVVGATSNDNYAEIDIVGIKAYNKEILQMLSCISIRQIESLLLTELRGERCL